jgi:peroxiredoxin
MNVILVTSIVAVSAITLFLGFLVLGTLRGIALVNWRLDQLEATTPNRMNRTGLSSGRAAPDFSLPDVTGTRIALADFAGRDLLLVFVQAGCSHCHAIVPELNRLQRSGRLQVLAVNHADPDAARSWARQAGASFPVLVQEEWDVSRQYEVFATPFAFVIDARGIIASKGIVNSAQQIGFVLSRRQDDEIAEDTNLKVARRETIESAVSAPSLT